MTSVYLLTNVVQRYARRTVLDIAHLTVEAGEFLAIIGPSGAGKSTLLRLLAFLETSSEGEIRFFGRKIDASYPTLDQKRSVGMVFQQPRLLSRTVYDNVAYGLKLRGQSSERVTPMLEALGLAALAKKPARTLSGGEQQRVALARALVLRPKVLLLDEPTANLDPANVKRIESIVSAYAAETGATVVSVTHNIHQARRLAQRTALLMDGNLVEIAENDCLFERPTQPETAAFLRGDFVY